jgi:hypothetical protein
VHLRLRDGLRLGVPGLRLHLRLRVHLRLLGPGDRRLAVPGRVLCLRLVSL